MMALNTVFLKYLFVFLLLLAGVCSHAQTVDFASNVTGGCAPLSVALTNKSTGFSSAADYTWDLGNGNVSKLKDPGVTYKDAKKYTVKLTVIDAGKTYTRSMDIAVYKNPQVDFSLDLTKGCVPLPVTFTSKSLAGDGTIVNYFWDFGDGSLESNGSLVQEHTYYTAQTTTVALTVRNSFGCLSTQAKKAALTVSPALKAEFSAKRTVLCSVNDTVAFTNASSGSGKLTYTWNFGDGKVSAAKEPIHRYSSKGSYPVKLSISNSEGCVSESSGGTIISVADFHTDFDLPQLICENSAALFTDKSNPASGSQAWTIDGAKYDALSTGLTATFNDVNPHKIQLTKNYNGCPDTVTKIIRATASPKLAGFIADLQETCSAPATVTFKDTTRSAVKWAWDFNNHRENFNPVAFIQAPSFTFDSAGVYYTLLQVTNAAGCSASAGKSIAVGQANIHIVSSIGDYSCENSLVTFSVQSDVGIKKYSWEFSDDASTSNQSNPKHTFLKKGNYTVTLRYTTINGCNSTTSFSISVLEKPAFDFTATPGTVICGNNPVKFIVSGANTRGDYYWNFGDDTGYIYRPYNVQHRFTSDTTFTVSLVIQNAGCSDTLTKKDYIKVLPPFPKVSRIINTCNGTRGLVTLQETSKKANSGTWNFGDGSAVESYDSAQTEVKHIYSATGTYKVALTVTNGGCTVSDTVNVPVLLKQNPLLSSPETEICRSGKLTVQVSNLENSYYSFSTNHFYAVRKFELTDGIDFDGATSLGSDLSFAADSSFYLYFQTNGNKRFRIITNSAKFNCPDTTNYISVKVKGPYAGFYMVSGDNCFKSPVAITDTSKADNDVPITQWEWDYGDGVKDIFNKTGPVIHKYENPGKYPVSLVVTDQDGCSAFSQPDSARVKGPKAAFTLSANPVSPGSIVTLYNESNNAGTDSLTNQYTWFYGDGSYSRSGYNENPSHRYLDKGSDTIRLIAASAGNTCADTAVQYLHVKNVNLAFTFTTAYVYPETGCPPVIARFTNKSVNTKSISWDFGDGSTAADSNFVSHTYRKPGLYKVTLYGYSDNGTIDSVADFLTVKGPYATLKADKLFACGSDAITLSTVSHNAISYAWDFGDGTVLETRDTFAVHHYLTPGIYTPFLVLKDGSGCQFAPYQLAGKIVVDTLHISLNISSLICSAAGTRFSSEILSIAKNQLQQSLQYHWDFGTGNPADTSANETADFTYARAGTYPVSLKVASPYGCTIEMQADILVHQAVKGRIAGPEVICQDDAVLFAATADTILTDLKWKWIFPNKAVSTKQDPDVQQFQVPGNDTVMLVVNNAGCTDTAFHTVEVRAKPPISIAPAQPFICAGDSIQLHVPAGPAYHWETLTSINSQDAVNPFVFPSATTVYVVKAIDAFGCTNRDSVTVSVVQKLEMMTDDSVYLCKGSSVQLKASGADKYLWIDGNDLSNTQIPNPVTSTVVPRSYTVVGFDKYGCFSDTAVTKVKIEQLPVIDAGLDVTTQAGVEVQLNAVSGNDVVTWHWQPSTYLSCSDCPSPKSTPRSEISYIVEAVTEHNCKARDTVNIHLLCKGSLLKIPTAFTPNGDMVNDYFRISGDGIRLIKHIVIFGRWGEKLFEKSNVSPNDRSAGWDGKYQGNPLPTGTYVYIGEIICDTGESFTYKGTVTLVR